LGHGGGELAERRKKASGWWLKQPLVTQNVALISISKRKGTSLRVRFKDGYGKGSGGLNGKQESERL